MHKYLLHCTLYSVRTMGTCVMCMYNVVVYVRENVCVNVCVNVYVRTNDVPGMFIAQIASNFSIIQL